MKSLQRKHEIVYVGHAVPFAAQPADEFKPQLSGEAPQVAEPHLLQEVTSVAPEHHVDVHVLCTLPVATVGQNSGETFGCHSYRGDDTKHTPGPC